MALKVGTTIKISLPLWATANQLRICFSVQIGIIGGTGLDDPDILRDREEILVDTPYGKVWYCYIMTEKVLASCHEFVPSQVTAY